MAIRKRRQYSLGDWIVGAFKSLPSPMPDLTHFSNALSQVYCREGAVQLPCEMSINDTFTSWVGPRDAISSFRWNTDD